MKSVKWSFGFVGAFALGVAVLSGCGGGTKEDPAAGKGKGGDQGSIKSSGNGDESGENKQQPQDIVSTAIGAGSFNTLVAAVKAAGLVETLQGDGPFTVFAPSDEAFAKLPAGTVENLLKPENKEQLIAILTYHVVPGKVLAADVLKLSEAATVNGKSLRISADDDSVKVNDSKVLKTDIQCSNGVIHVIDSVLLPE